MYTNLRQRVVVMSFSVFFAMTLLISCSNVPSNIKKLDTAFSSGDYVKTMELASRYLQQDIQSGYLLYKGVSAAFLGLPEESSRALELYLAISSQDDEGRPLALKTMLTSASQAGRFPQVISVANELERLGQGTVETRMELYKALIATGDSTKSKEVLSTLLAPVLDAKSLCLLAVEAHSDTSLVASSLSAWFSTLSPEYYQQYLDCYCDAVSYIGSRPDGGSLLPLAKTIYESGIYADTYAASQIAYCLGELYAVDGQKVLARRFWNEALKLDGNPKAQERLSTQ